MRSAGNAAGAKRGVVTWVVDRFRRSRECMSKDELPTTTAADGRAAGLDRYSGPEIFSADVLSRKIGRKIGKTPEENIIRPLDTLGFLKYSGCRWCAARQDAG